MMDQQTTSQAQTLIHQGNAALRAGDTFEARKHFRRATELQPDNAEAWLGLAGAVRPFQEKRDYLQRALEIDPENSEAQASLTYVENKISTGAVLAPPANAAEPGEPTEGTPGAPAATAAAAEAAGTATTEITTCYRHPDRETGLRCVQCARPICTECIRPAFVGQLCPECARERRPRNYQVSAGNLVVAALITFPLSLVVSYLIGVLLGRSFFFIFLSIFIAPAAAELLIRLLDQVSQAKRGRSMQLTVVISYVLGAAPWILLPLVIYGFPPLGLLLFTVIAIATLIGRLR